MARGDAARPGVPLVQKTTPTAEWIARGLQISDSTYTWQEVAAAFKNGDDVAVDLEDGMSDPDEVPPDTEPWDDGSDDDDRRHRDEVTPAAG